MLTSRVVPSGPLRIIVAYWRLYCGPPCVGKVPLLLRPASCCFGREKRTLRIFVWRHPDTVSDFTGARITYTSSSESDHVLPLQPELLEQTGIKYVLSQPFGQLMLRACERQKG